MYANDERYEERYLRNNRKIPRQCWQEVWYIYKCIECTGSGLGKVFWIVTCHSLYFDIVFAKKPNNHNNYNRLEFSYKKAEYS